MTTNMGNADRWLRVLLAAFLVFLAFGTGLGSAGILHWLFIIVAAVFALTAITGNCPLYSVAGIKTCKN